MSYLTAPATLLFLAAIVVLLMVTIVGGTRWGGR